MLQARNPKTKKQLIPHGLITQLVTIILLPLTLILLAITFGSISIHQHAMRTMVGERDGRTVNFAAKALSAQVELRMEELNGLAQTLPVDTANTGLLSLANTQSLLQNFDLGIALFDPDGKRLSLQGDPQLWDALGSNSPGSNSILPGILLQARRVNVISSPVSGKFIALIGVVDPINRALVGAFSIPALVENTLGEVISTSSQLFVLLIDQDAKVLFSNSEMLDFSATHPGVVEALRGESGTVYVKYGNDEHVTAYSPVTAAGWALITEESWEAVSTPTLRTTQVAPLVLVPALLIMSLALWFGTRQIIQPLRTLEAKANRLAGGDFTSIQQSVGGIAEIQHLQDELVAMATKVQEAQRSLHGYIGSITAAQEDERLRMARELHDDTLQALIALKQRVQLAQLEKLPSDGQPAARPTELDEIATLAEQTIENLRRITRALRPIYLEDLGLVPALEMLTRENAQGSGPGVEFHHTGVERRLDAPVELALYRMVQEALSNVYRHSQATRASIQIDFSHASVRLSVQDNGVGFTPPENPSDFSSRGHYGLLGLHERAELIGADIEIISSPGSGTRLTVTLPG